jgi:hypothetical protein
MNGWRKFITSGVAFSFAVVGATGVIFQFFFKNHVLEHIHGWIGVAMVAAALLHLGQNWRVLKNHLRDRRAWLLLAPIALVIAFFTATQPAANAGVNPRAVVRQLASASAGNVAQTFGKDLNRVFATMQADGVHAQDARQSLREIALANRKPVEAVLGYFVD